MKLTMERYVFKLETLSNLYLNQTLGKRLCTLKFPDPLELMDGCMGTYELVLTESDTVNVVLYVRTTDDQSFKHLHCYKNIVPMALGAAVGGVCGVTMIGTFKCSSTLFPNASSKH